MGGQQSQLYDSATAALWDVKRFEKELHIANVPPHLKFFGFANEDNVCFCNAVLQLLFHCDPFRQRVLEYYKLHKKKKHSGCNNVLRALGSLFNSISKASSRCGVASPKKFLGKFTSAHPAFPLGIQQDAQEFFSTLLNEIADDLALQKVGSDSSTPLKKSASIESLSSAKSSTTSQLLTDSKSAPKILAFSTSPRQNNTAAPETNQTASASTLSPRAASGASPLSPRQGNGANTGVNPSLKQSHRRDSLRLLKVARMHALALSQGDVGAANLLPDHVLQLTHFAHRTTAASHPHAGNGAAQQHAGRGASSQAVAKKPSKEDLAQEIQAETLDTQHSVPGTHTHQKQSTKRILELVNRDADQLTAQTVSHASGGRDTHSTFAAHTRVYSVSNLGQSRSEQDVSRARGLTWVEELFGGVLLNETKCLNCGAANVREDRFLDLSMEIKNNTSLMHALRNFSQKETLSGDNAYYCHHCKQKSNATKCLKLKQVGKMLVFHLKRFQYSAVSDSLLKLSYRLMFPLEIRLPSSVFHEAPPRDLPIYDLFAFVVHVGSSIELGHYVTMLKIAGQWFLFDDETIQMMSEEDVSACFGSTRSPTHNDAYLLFYRKREGD